MPKPGILLPDRGLVISKAGTLAPMVGMVVPKAGMPEPKIRMLVPKIGVHFPIWRMAVPNAGMLVPVVQVSALTRLHRLLISMLSRICFGAPRLATSIIARPNCSVVVTYFGKAFSRGKSGRRTT